MFLVAIRLLLEIAMLLVVGMDLPCRLLLPQEGTFSKRDKHLICAMLNYCTYLPTINMLVVLRMLYVLLIIKQYIRPQFFVTFIVNTALLV